MILTDEQKNNNRRLENNSVLFSYGLDKSLAVKNRQSIEGVGITAKLATGTASASAATVGASSEAVVVSFAEYKRLKEVKKNA